MSDKNCIFEYHRQVRQRKIFRELNALVFPNRAKRSHSVFVCFARNNNQRSLKVVQAKQAVADVDPVFERPIFPFASAAGMKNHQWPREITEKFLPALSIFG